MKSLKKLLERIRTSVRKIFSSEYDSEKIISLDTLGKLRDIVGDQKFVATNGCFDVLHAGHVKLLRRSKDFGNVLVVGLNSDESVRELKGEDRPINNQKDRALVLAELECVDFVCIFNDKRASLFLDAVRPHFYIKGGDYTAESLDEEELSVLEFHETKIEIIPLHGDLSTTNIINKL